MTTRLTKEQVPFLVAAMDEKHGITKRTKPTPEPVRATAGKDANGNINVFAGLI